MRERYAEADDRHPHRRPSGRYGGEATERQFGHDVPRTQADSAPTAGYYSAATPQRSVPRAGRATGLDRSGQAESWAEPYAEHRRARNRIEADDDGDTHVFSLVSGRTAADDRPDRMPSSTRGSFLDDADDAGEPDVIAGDRTEAKLARQVAAIASLAAGVVHVFATPTHWEEWPLAGAFFAATAGFQLLWGMLALLAGNAFIRVVGLLANVGFLGLWAVSRVWGVPFGPHAGVPEAFGAADLIVAAMEVAIVVGVLWSLLPRERHGVLSTGGYRAVVAFSFIALGAIAIPGASAALEHSHSHDTETADHEGDDHDHDHGTDETTDTESPADSGTSAEPSEEESEPAEEDHDHTHAPGEEHD